MSPIHRARSTQRSFLMSSLIPFSDRYFEKLHLSSRPGLLPPVFSNPDYPENINTSSLCSQNRSPQTTIYHFLTSDRLQPLADLVADNPSNKDWLLYLQLSSYYHHIGNKPQLHRKLSPFETFCSQETCPSRTISSMYRILMTEKSSQAGLPFQGRWELELGCSISLTHKSSISVYTQEKSYKSSPHGIERLTFYKKFIH